MVKSTDLPEKKKKSRASHKSSVAIDKSNPKLDVIQEPTVENPQEVVVEKKKRKPREKISKKISSEIISKQEDSADNNLEEKKSVEERSDEETLTMLELCYQFWWRWADFSLEIKSPEIEHIDPPKTIAPEALIDGDGFEHVYPIQDFGYKFSTSKGEELFTSGLSMCKMYFTIEKIISLFIERLKSGGIDTQTEVQVLFFGHELTQRKAFESIINLNYNVVVSNFDPASWGDRYLQMVKKVSDSGYGYPTQAPRDNYRQSYGMKSLARKRT